MSWAEVSDRAISLSGNGAKSALARSEALNLYEDVAPLVGERTLEILDRRRKTAKIKRRGWLVRRMLLLADLIALSLAFLAAELLFGPGGGAGDMLDMRGEYLVFLATLPVWVLMAKVYSLYERDEERTAHSTVDEIVGVFHLVTVGAWILIAGAWLTGLVTPNVPKLLFFWLLAIVFLTIGRIAARAYSRRQITYLQNAIIVGAGDVGQLVARKVLQHPEYGINLVGFVDAEPKERRDDLGPLTLLGSPERLLSLVQLFDVERVIVAFSGDDHDKTLELIRSLKRLDIQVDVVPRLFEVVGPKVDIHTVEGLPLIGLPPLKISRSSRVLKRGVDIFGSFSLLLVTWPFFIYAAWRIRRESPGPVLFRQTRLGLDMRPFTALKFRTMHVDTDEAKHRAYIEQTMTVSATPSNNGLYKLDRAESITPFGRWLRRTSLDELPQLLNVLRGDMSLVGPRPCIPYEIELFAPHHFDRFAVPAGITGLWQVTARAHSTFLEAIDMDVAYARSWSLGLDLSLLLRTPRQLLRQRETC